MSNLAGIWVLLQVICVLGGWTLSLLGQVNALGYVVLFAVAGGVLALWAKRRRPGGAGSGRGMGHPVWSRYVRRFRRVFPMLFLLAALGSLVGGALYAPNNYDALSYRLPRMLMWWDHGGWHWIDTPDPRMNFSAADFEWLTMPILVLTHSDRFLFLVNLAGFLLMPGLLFSVLVEAGVAARVAWAWMWLLPMGFCFLMQSGSIGNDTLAGIDVLAAVYFAFRARKTGRAEDVGLALLAAGLATGVKACNLPLLLPLFFAVRPALGLLRSRLVFGVGILLLSAGVSFCPMAVLNEAHAGHWTGDPRNLRKMQIQNPMAGILGNSLEMTAEILSPPILPWARNITGWVWSHFPERLLAELKRDFPRFQWQVGELPQEESSGLGLGVTVLLAAGIFPCWKRRAAAGPGRRRPGVLIGLMAWAALLVFMAKLGTEGPSRLASAYYPLVILPLLLIPTQARRVRQRWWRILAVVFGAGALLALALTPSRPLWPAGRVCDWLAAKYPRSAEAARMRKVYAVYANRSSLMAPLRRQIPDTVLNIGLLDEIDDADASLWQPYGSRSVRYLTPVGLRRPPDMEWVVIKQQAFESETGRPLDPWLEQTGGVVVARDLIPAKASQDPNLWYVVRFRDPLAGRN